MLGTLSNNALAAGGPRAIVVWHLPELQSLQKTWADKGQEHLWRCFR